MELVALASAVSRTAQGMSLRATSRLHGITVDKLEDLRQLIQPHSHWTSFQLLRQARSIRGEDLVTLERIFTTVHRAADKKLPRHSDAIRTVCQQLRGASSMAGAPSGDAAAGLAFVLKLAKLDRRTIALRPNPGTPFGVEVVSPDPKGVIGRCWVEAVALGLLAARLGHHTSGDSWQGAVPGHSTFTPGDEWIDAQPMTEAANNRPDPSAPTFKTGDVCDQGMPGSESAPSQTGGSMKPYIQWNTPVVVYDTSVGEPSAGIIATHRKSPTFGQFFAEWRDERRPEWRRLHLQGVDDIATPHLLPWFASRAIGEISKADILKFRAHLATLPGRGGKSLSNSRINKILGILSQILSEAAERFGFSNPMMGIKKLKTRRPQVEPFSMEEMQRICDAVSPEWRDYMIVRFRTGMRTGEINGLRWGRVNFERGVIEVREIFSAGQAEDNAKSEASVRDIPMLEPVAEVLKARSQSRPDPRAYVFSSPRGQPVDAKNFTNRVFYPLLDRLGIARRRPYQTRHTTATLLLASGENPEWIARFLGHTDTQMLFTTYSKYVPNLTRNDGAAVTALLQAAGKDQNNRGDAREPTPWAPSRRLSSESRRDG